MDSPEHLRRFALEYLETQAPDEVVEHLERVASERLFGREYDVWDVHTDQGRWWVISSPMNLYSQELIKSLDAALSFHIGLTLRVTARAHRPAAPSEAQERFTVAWRRLAEASDALGAADEAEDFQAVGMRCREALLMFARAIATDEVRASLEGDAPKASDFVAWSSAVADTVAAGASAKERRSYLKTITAEAWSLCGWLTHAQHATRFDAHLGLDAAEHAMNVMGIAFSRWDRGDPDRCPECASYRVTTDSRWDDDAGELDHFYLCEKCGWELSYAPSPSSRPADDAPAETSEPTPSSPPEGECIEGAIGTFETPTQFIERHS